MRVTAFDKDFLFITEDDVTSSDEYLELKAQLERERSLRIHLEEKVQRLESLYPISAVTSTDKLQENVSTEQITLQYLKEEMVSLVIHKSISQ